MDFWISVGVAALIEALSSRKDVERNADKIAKVYVKIKRAIDTNPTLAGAITRQEMK